MHHIAETVFVDAVHVSVNIDVRVYLKPRSFFRSEGVTADPVTSSLWTTSGFHASLCTSKAKLCVGFKVTCFFRLDLGHSL